MRHPFFLSVASACFCLFLKFSILIQLIFFLIYFLIPYKHIGIDDEGENFHDLEGPKKVLSPATIDR